MSIILTRRSALIGGFTSLLLPTASAGLIGAAAPVDPWEQVALHAFALQDALQALPEQWWFIHKIGHGHGDRMAALNPVGSGGHRDLFRPSLGSDT